MDGTPSRPVVTPAYSVKQSRPHQILVCKGCKPTRMHRRPGSKMVVNLRRAIEDRGLVRQFEVASTLALPRSSGQLV